MSRIRIASTFTLVAVFSVVAAPLNANQPVKIERVTYSAWAYSYDTPHGTVHGQCAWKDSAGSYHGGGATGQFTNIASTPQSDGTVQVKGNWSAGSISGTFRFLVSANKESFTGQYWFDGNDTAYPWNGKQTYGFTKYSANSNGSRYCCKCYFLNHSGDYDWCWCIWQPNDGHKCFWCLQNHQFWGCCKPNGHWWEWSGGWTYCNTPPQCPGCNYPCDCFPPEPTNTNDIPLDPSISNIPQPQQANSSVFNNH